MPSQRSQLMRRIGVGLCVWLIAASALAQQPTGTTVTLTWQPNTEADLAGYQLFRALTPCAQAVQGTTLTQLATLTKDRTTYTDPTVPDGLRAVCYGLTAFDEAGNVSLLSALAEKTFPLALLAPPTGVTFVETTRTFAWTPNPQATLTKLYVHKMAHGAACPEDFWFCGTVTGTATTIAAMPWESANDCWMTSVNADGLEGPRQAVSCDVGARPAAQLLGHWDQKTDVAHDPKQNLKRYTIHALVNPRAALTGFHPILVKNYTYMLYASSRGHCGEGGILANQMTGKLCVPTPLAPATWTALTMIYDGTALILYRNGTLVGSKTTAPPNDATGLLQIGGSKFNEVCNCDLEVWLYDQAMTAAEVSTLPTAPTTAAVIRATPSILTFTAVVNEADPLSQRVTIENAGAGSLAWTATSTQPWLLVTPTSGQQSGALTVAAARGILAAGTYLGSVTLTAPGATPVSIAVTLTVTPDVTPPAPPSGVKIIDQPQ